MSSILDQPAADVDPVDVLIPPPRPRWVRFVIGAAAIGVVGLVAVLWGRGHLQPRPDCCGSGSASSVMSLSPDGEAVTITASVFNSSDGDLIVESATGDLPGAAVIKIEMLDDDNNQYPTDNTQPLPAPLPAGDLRRVIITFVPTECDARPAPWGTATLQLSNDNGWLPSIGRSYTVPVLEQEWDLSVFGPAWVDPSMTKPLEAACAMLRR
jgi:hypothetical protein